MTTPRSTAGSTSARPRATWQRAAVAGLLTRTPEFRSAQQIHAALEAEGTKVGLATVYRNLTAMAEAGDVDHVRNTDGEILYRACEDLGHHHHHLVCRRCGHAVEVSDPALESWVTEVSTSHGFTHMEHTAEFFGLCARCSALAEDEQEAR
ncbi:Fur family transcriptional regulator [Actinomyces sp. W5033]|uniref:Fur family transcriptional regulator n=1 Tax=Actinomyces sp. W5033 TaxID=3446479 RepID=UPI003EDFBCB3